MLQRAKILLPVILAISFLAFKLGPQTDDDGTKNSYIGVERCGMCHKSEKQGKQIAIWQESKHSKAYKTLQSKAADSIALAKGFKTPAVQTEACLKCHVTGYNIDASLKGPKFKVEDGVQCETCHGAGSNYWNASVMKDRKLAMTKGLIIHEEKEKFCTGCHNSESPTFVEFNYDKYWAKIAHMVPKEK